MRYIGIRDILDKNNKITMKETIMMMIAAVLLCGCEKTIADAEYYDEDGVDEVDEKRVTFDVDSRGWDVSTRSLVADDSEMTDLWLFDYVDGELVNTLHKSQGDADFDTPSLSMKYGQHTVYFVASRGKSPAVDGTAIVWQQPSDTFWKALTLDVSRDTGNIAVVLDRVATRFRLVVNDLVPDGLSTVCITPSSWWYGLDYQTGDVVAQQQTERSIAVPASYVGTSGQLKVTVFGMSNDDEWTTDITITAKDADGNSLGSVTLNAVPFLRNRTTEASGRMFSTEDGFSVSLDGGWVTDRTVQW